MEKREYEELSFQGDDAANSAADYLALADRSESQGRILEAAYQLLAAYEKAQREFQGSFLFEGHPALEGLRHAWDLACLCDERSLAGHIFERMEPYLSFEEAERLSGMFEPTPFDGLLPLDPPSPDADEIAGIITGDLIQAAGGTLLPDIAEEAVDGESVAQADEREPLGPGSCRLCDLVGFDDEVEKLRTDGIIPSDDEEYRRFIQQLKLQHGIEAVPARCPLVFHSPAREDADTLMLAAGAEMDMPSVRMRMDSNAIGDAILCVMMANGITAPNAVMANGFQGPGILVLEGIDSWNAPDPMDGYGYGDDPDFPGSLSHGARKALMLIRSAVLDPRVTVLASASDPSRIQGPILDVLGHCEFIEVPNPGEAERDALWDHLMSAHISLSALDRYELVRLTANMPRCDIRSAAREAVEQAYRESIAKRLYLPVTRENLLDKIAAYQPLESQEYLEIEESLVEDLRGEIELLERSLAEGEA